MVGVPASLGGERVWAFVILEQGSKRRPREIKRYCREVLKPYEIPGEVCIVVDYTCTETGKPQKFKLRQVALDMTQTEGAAR